ATSLSSMTPPPPRSTLFPYTTLFRSRSDWVISPQTGPSQTHTLVRPFWFTTENTENTEDRRTTGSALLASTGSFLFSVLSVLCRSEEHTSELQSLTNLVCRLLLEKKK